MQVRKGVRILGRRKDEGRRQVRKGGMTQGRKDTKRNEVRTQKDRMAAACWAFTSNSD